MDLKQQEKSLNKKKFAWFGFFKGFALLLTYELIEEAIEEFIAWSITTVMAKAISFLMVVVLTQVTKATAKIIAKGFVIVVKPFIKNLTYKAGNDKVNKIIYILRRIFKMEEKENKVEVVEQEHFKSEFFAKIGKFIKDNWQTGLGLCAFVYVILEAVFNWIGNGLIGLGIQSNIAYAIMTPLYGLIVNALGQAGLELGSKKDTRILAKKIGYDSSYNVLLYQKAEMEKLEQERIEKEQEQQRLIDIAKKEEERRQAEQQRLIDMAKEEEEKQKFEHQKLMYLTKQQEFNIAKANGTTNAKNVVEYIMEQQNK